MAISRTRWGSMPDWINQTWQKGTQTERSYNDWNQPPVSTVVTPFDCYSEFQTPRGQRVTVDENHGRVDWSRNSLRHRGDVGGHFNSRKSAITVSNGRHISIEAKYTSFYHVKLTYKGPLFAVNPSTIALPPSIESPQEVLNTLGTTAIARCKPTNSIANVSTAIGEIFREGVPKLFGATLWKEKTNLARGASGEFLNSEFGWKPVVSDIRSISYAAANSDSILSQYERNAGRSVRRRYEFPAEVSQTIEDLGYSDGWIAYPNSQYIDSSRPMPKLYKTTRSLKRTWFSGAFTYHLPTGYRSRNGLRSAAAKAGPLLGLELTPEVVWNLTPWTWAIDWFSNAGDVVSNLSDWATDGLVMPYGYIMEHSIHEYIYELLGPTRYKPDYPYAATVTSRIEVKKRLPASPFGFGLELGSFSPRQMAIAAALGLSRAF